MNKLHTSPRPADEGAELPGWRELWTSGAEQSFTVLAPQALGDLTVDGALRRAPSGRLLVLIRQEPLPMPWVLEPGGWDARPVGLSRVGVWHLADGGALLAAVNTQTWFAGEAEARLGQLEAALQGHQGGWLMVSDSQADQELIRGRVAGPLAPRHPGTVLHPAEPVAPGDLSGYRALVGLA